MFYKFGIVVICLSLYVFHDVDLMLTNFIERIVGAEQRAFVTIPYRYSCAERLYSISRSGLDCVVKVTFHRG